MLGLTVALCVAASLGCEDDDCREPTDVSQLHAKFAERSDTWVQDADPYPLQREKIGVTRSVLKPFRERLVREREQHTNAMIDAFVGAQPDAPRIHALVDAAQKSSMVYGWKLFDLAFGLQKLFTTAQRERIAAAMLEPPEPFETPFLAKRAIDYVMFKVDADDAQKAAVDGAVQKTEVKINVMLKKQHGVKTDILKHWVEREADQTATRQLVQSSSDDVTRFVHDLVDQSVSLASKFRPDQRAFVDDRLTRMKTCPAK